MNYRRWTDWWGTNNPKFPDNWNTGGTVLMSLGDIPGLPGFFGLPGTIGINAGDTIGAGYELTLDGNHPAATVSLVSGGNITADIACAGGTSYTLTVRSRPRAIRSQPVATAPFHQTIRPARLSFRARSQPRLPLEIRALGAIQLRPTSAPWDYPKAAMATLEDLVF
jgi:hypothetical protein